MSAFLPGDRVICQTRATYEVVSANTDELQVRARDGHTTTFPTDLTFRAPLIRQPDGSFGYEFQPGQAVLWIDERADWTNPTIRRGTVVRYLDGPEAANDGREYDAIVLKVDDAEIVTTVNTVYVDPNTSFYRPLPEDDDELGEPMPFKERDRFKALLHKHLDFTKLDWNGHLKRGALWSSPGWFEPVEKRTKELMPDFILGGPSKADAEALQAAFESGVPLDRWVRLGRPMHTHYLGCPYCDGSEYRRFFETNGVDVRLGPDACPNPDGQVDNNFTLNIPSGKLLVANDLRELAPVSREFDVNKAIGRMRTTDTYAKAGMAHGSVGNTCPGVFRLADGSFTIGSYHKKVATGDGEYDYDYEDDLPEGAVRVAGVCTDLWWYSIMDYDLAKARCDALKIKWAAVLKHANIVEVEPGTYSFVHHNDLPDRDAPTVIFASFRRTGDAVAVEGDPYLDHFLNQTYTAGQVLAQHMKDWPTLYDQKVWEARLARAADHIMCVNGNGIDWHRNGHPIGEVDPDTVPIERIPVWKGIRHWYPMSPGYSAIFRAAGLFASKPYGPGTRSGRYGEHLNESFQELAYRILQNIIRYGQEPYGHAPPKDMSAEAAWEAEVKRCREIMANCVEAFRRLCRRYPDTFATIDPEFTAWMHKRKTVEAWVADVTIDWRKMPPRHAELIKAFQEAETARLREMWAKLKETKAEPTEATT